MRVINISLDNKILDKDSSVAKRTMSFAGKLENLLVICVGKNGQINLADNILVKGIRKSNKILSLFALRKFLHQELVKNKYDLITIQDAYWLAKLGVCVANKFGIKSEIQVHGFEKLNFITKVLAKQNFAKADRIRTVSLRLKNQLIKDFAVDEQKIYVVPIAVDKDKILSEEISVNLKEKYSNDFIFLTVARLVAVKNIAMQIKALAELENKNTKLIIVGDGSEKENLKSLAKDLDLLDRVIFEGWLDDLNAYYKSADCLLLSSDSEGYGAVVAEAVLLGLPIIMTDVGVAGELVEDNVNGLIVPVDNQEKFIQAMNSLVVDNDLKQKFSTNSLQFRNKILDKDELLNKTIDNWKSIV
ncbi:MAG: glycosyltransferase [Candidatus Komeilibacteria bacterium]|jgi:glycosyltransferase involved in cell wall biosynthesis|nr:glycosyltransferase [Candidatus Komeilibacteria bacterium]MBT4448018.1 glycosyltransferase [Candidatus Komeilibacteria bacterium]